VEEDEWRKCIGGKDKRKEATEKTKAFDNSKIIFKR
jgi:hypothetical protein